MHLSEFKRMLMSSTSKPCMLTSLYHAEGVPFPIRLHVKFT